MKLFRDQRGLTLIETLFTATIVSFMMLGMINLISIAYKGLISSRLKTIAFEAATENMEKYRKLGFGSLRNNPGYMQTMATIKASGDSYYYDSFTDKNTTFEIYRFISFAKENENGDIVPVSLSEGISTDLKMVKIDVQYTDMAGRSAEGGVVKTTELVAYVTNREIPSEGSTIFGTLTAASGPALTTGSGPMVYVVTHPELTTAAISNGGTIQYSIKNVPPGQFNLWAEAFGYYPTTCTANPISVTNTVGKLGPYDIALPPADTGTLSGNVYFAEQVTLKAAGSYYYGSTAPNWKWAHTQVPAGDDQIYLQDIIGENDSKWMYTTDDFTGNSRNIFFTEFAFCDFGGASVGRPVRVALRISGTAKNTTSNDVFRIYLHNNLHGQGNTPTAFAAYWNKQPNPWNIYDCADVNFDTVNSFYRDIPAKNFPDSGVEEIDLTNLYSEGAWDWPKVNSITAAVRVLCLTPNPAPTPVQQFYVFYMTMVVDFLASAGANTMIYANDGLSSQVMTNSAGRYLLPNVYTGPSTNTVNAYAIKLNTFWPPDVCTRPDIILAKGQSKRIDFGLRPSPSGSGTIAGRVIDSSTNLGIVGASLLFTSDASGATGTGVSVTDGVFTIGPVPTGAGTLIAVKTNYLQTSDNKCTVFSYTGDQKIYMKPVGKISGRVTDNATSAGIDKIKIVARKSTGTLEAECVTSGGGYYTLTVTAIAGGETYYTEPKLDGTVYMCVFPLNKKQADITIGPGSSVINKHFRLAFNYLPISGYITMNNLSGSDERLTDGVLIIAQPTSNTIMAQGDSGFYFSTTATGKEQNGFFRTTKPSYSTIGKQDGTYTVMVPVYGGNYDIYAYYTYCSITSQVLSSAKTPPAYVRTYWNFYRKITAIPPDSTAANQTGAWTPY